MRTAENLQILHDGGCKTQAETQAENLSIWKTQNWKNETTVFGFPDESAIFSSCQEFREATKAEIESYK